MKSWLAGIALAVTTSASILPGADLSDARANDIYQLLQLDRRLVKWGAPQIGTGAYVSYAFVSETTQFPGARNCKEMQSPAALLSDSAIAPADFVREVEAAFAMWEAAADIRFHRVNDPKTAQILIGADTASRGTAFANVRYDQTAPPRKDGVETIQQSLVCLNPERSWKIGFSNTPRSYDLRYTLAHEIGHAIGLDHPSPTGQLMSFTYEERFRELQAGDIAGAVALYGARPARPILASVGKPEPIPASAVNR